MRLQELRQSLERKKGQRDQLIASIDKAKTFIKREKRNLRNIEEAQVIVQQVAKETQEELVYSITELPSLALANVFDDKPYSLQAEFNIKRGKTEADLFFEREGKRRNPLSSAGLGTANVASFALRPTMYSLAGSKPRPVFILDEPFIRLKGVEPNKRALAMVKEISKELGIQVLMVSDERVSEEMIIDNADKIFRTTLRNGKSKVEVIE